MARATATGRQPMEIARLLIRVEAGFALLLISVFVLPEWTDATRVPALVLAAALAAGHALLDRRRPLVPLAMVAYIAIYLLAIVLSDFGAMELADAGQLVGLPVFALAVAWAAQDPEVRRRMLWISVAAVAIQLPVVASEVVDVISELGWDDAVLGADSVTGLLGDSQASTVGQCAVFAATIVLGAGCAGAIRMRTAVAGAIALLLLCALTSTRAAYLFVPLALGAMAVGLLLVDRPERIARVQVVGALAIAITPFLFIATDFIYPGANKAIVTFSGIVATVEEGDQQLDASEQAEVDPEIVRPSVSTRLPGRFEQLRHAVELSVDDGAASAVLGRGVSITALPDPEAPITRTEQNAGTVWLARTLVETGWLGVVAFAVLIGYMLVLWWRSRAGGSESAWDGALWTALPGIVMLTVLGAAYNEVMVTRAYSALFWAFLGLAIAASASSRSDPSPERRGPAEPEHP